MLDSLALLQSGVSSERNRLNHKYNLLTTLNMKLKAPKWNLHVVKQAKKKSKKKKVVKL